MALDRAPNVIRQTEKLVNDEGFPTRDTTLSITEMWRQIVAGFAVVPCLASGTDAIVLTPRLHQEGSANYGDHMVFAAVAAATSTGAVTASVESLENALPSVKIYKDNGATQAGAGDIVADGLYFFAYNSALDSGAGGFVLVGEKSAPPTPPTPPTQKGYLFGLVLSVNALDPMNDIDIAAGEAVDNDDVDGTIMTLASALTKQIDAAWAVGTNQGGADAAVIDGTWHVWLIQRSDTEVVDALLSLSPTAPTMPTDYDRKRRIGSLLVLSGEIVSFVQDAANTDIFWLNDPVNNSDPDPGVSAVVVALAVPDGIVVDAIFTGILTDDTPAAATTLLFTSLAQTDTIPSSLLCDLSLAAAGAGVPQATSANFMRTTDISAQIRYRLTASNADISVGVTALGWVDTRGRLA